jgi:hypothetical protein
MDTWYFSPFPPEYSECRKLYFCEFTLEFFKKREHLLRHLRKCEISHPPGEERVDVYREDEMGDGSSGEMREDIRSSSLSLAPLPSLSPPAPLHTLITAHYQSPLRLSFRS